MFMSSPVHRRTSSIHAVLLLPGKHFSFYFTLNCSQNHAITSSFPVAVLREFLMPFSSGIPIFSRIHLLVFRSVQLIFKIRRYTHISKAVTSFSSHFFSAQLSDPYNAVLHISDRTSCFFRSIPMSFAFQILVSCRVACLAIASLAFISVVLLLSTVTNDPKYLNLFTLSISAINQHSHVEFQYGQDR